MLSKNHFYHRTIRKTVIAFGTIFKDIELYKYTKDSFEEISRTTVPLSYAGKEDFLTRLLGNPDLHNPTQITLPRMSFKMVGISYDPSRKLSSFSSSFHSIAGSNNTQYQQYAGTPYDLQFELYLYVRNVEDGTQIVEQILPFFNPDYTLTMNFVDDLNIKRDIPIILESVSEDNLYEGSAEETTRVITWTLTFKLKTYFFGPVNTAKLIRKSTANVYSDTKTSSDVIELNLASGNGSYKLGETIYVGETTQSSSVTADVLAWNTSTNILKVTNTVGKFTANSNVIGTISNTKRNINGVLPVSQQLVYISVTPDPPTANASDDFGYTEVIYESPNIP